MIDRGIFRGVLVFMLLIFCPTWSHSVNQLIQLDEGLEIQKDSGFYSIPDSVEQVLIQHEKRRKRFHYPVDFRDSSRVPYIRIEQGNFYPFPRFIDSTISFSEAIFKDSCTFWGAQFNYEIDFSNAEFVKHADFGEVGFGAKSYFAGTKFYSSSYFGKSLYLDTSRFLYTLFTDTTGFYEAMFEEETDFTGAHFQSFCSFQGAQFFTSAIFKETVFNGPIDFYDANFGRLLNLSESTFNNTSSFKGIWLPDTLDLSYIRNIQYEIDLTNLHLGTNRNDTLIDIVDVSDSANAQETCYINLMGTNLEKVKMKYDIFTLYFPEGASYEERTYVYETLLNQFKKYGYSESYQRLDVEYRKLKYKHKNQWYWNILQDYWWNYGYNKERIWMWTASLLLLFTIVSFICYPNLSNKIYFIDFLRYDFSSIGRSSNWRLLGHRFLHSLLYTCIIFFGLRMDISHFIKPARFYQ